MLPVPPLASKVTVRFAALVAGNTAVTTPESIGFVTEVAPATVKKLAATPVNVFPGFAVNVIVAV